MLKLFNTLTRKKEKFQPIREGKVGFYTCGPTVYGTPHIGNLRAFLFSDVLRRTLEFFNYEVIQVMNITDVGHLTSDSDAGEDKMEKGARRSKKTVWKIAKMYEEQFLAALKELNIKTPHQLPRATDHIEEQVELIKKLTEKGFTYETSDGIYFDTSKFSNYGKLSGQSVEDKEAGARVAVKDEKRNPADFALWKFCVGKNTDHVMRWSNPSGEGEGFPGWHIECSAMSVKYLGETFDIHTGGIDHIPVHHENEIAQSEATTGHQFVNYWLHNEFLTVDGGKMSKSLDNLYIIEDLREKGFDPISFRYLCLGTHYRQKLNFTWEALEGAQTALNKIRAFYQSLPKSKIGCAEAERQFEEALADDLNTPQALAVTWDLIKDRELPPEAKQRTLEKFDEVLGLDLDHPIEEERIEPNKEQAKLLKEREKARVEKNWNRSDRIRDQLATKGFVIEDTSSGQILKRK